MHQLFLIALREIVRDALEITSSIRVPNHLRRACLSHARCLAKMRMQLQNDERELKRQATSIKLPITK